MFDFWNTSSEWGVYGGYAGIAVALVYSTYYNWIHTNWDDPWSRGTDRIKAVAMAFAGLVVGATAGIGLEKLVRSL